MIEVRLLSIIAVLLVFPLKAHASQACLPENTSSEIVARYESEESSFTQYRITDPSALSGQYVVSESSGNCELVISPESYQGLPALHLDEHIEFGIAENLYIDFFRRRIELAGGLENFQALIDQSQNSNEPAFPDASPAEISALTHLGVMIPESTIIVSSDSEVNRVYALLTNAASPVFLADEVSQPEISDGYVLADYKINNAEGVVFAKLLENGGIEYIFSGPKEDYNPETISSEHQIPLSVFEGFEK